MKRQLHVCIAHGHKGPACPQLFNVMCSVPGRACMHSIAIKLSDTSANADGGQSIGPLIDLTAKTTRYRSQPPHAHPCVDAPLHLVNSRFYGEVLHNIILLAFKLIFLLQRSFRLA